MIPFIWPIQFKKEEQTKLNKNKVIHFKVCKTLTNTLTHSHTHTTNLTIITLLYN